MRKSPRYSCALLSLAVVWSSVGSSIPAFAAEIDAAPAARLTPLETVKVPGGELSAQLPTQIPTIAPLNGLMPIDTAHLAETAQTATAQASVSASPKTLAASAATPMTPDRGGATFLGRVTQAVGQAILGRSISWSTIFDANRAAPEGAMGIRPLPRPNLPNDFNLGDAPTTPDPKKVRTVTIKANAVDAPGARDAAGIFDSGPRVLNASVRGTKEEVESSVKEALLRMVDNDAAKWGVTRDELKDVHVVYVPAEGEQIGQVFAVFQQQRKTTNTDGTTQTAVVHGTSLSFTVNIVKNQPILMSANAKLYPNMNVATRATKTDDELKQSAEDQLRQMPQGANISLVFVERRIIYHEGAWKAVNLYDIDGLGQYVGVKVAIDIATGDIFAWDSRVGAKTDAAAEPRSRFAIAYRGITTLDPARAQAIKDKLASAGVTVVSESNGGALILAEGTVSQMSAIVQDPVFQGWTIHRYNMPSMAYPEPVMRVETARRAAGEGAQLIGAAANFLNKSNIWAYRFYIPSTNMVREVYVNFKGDAHATEPRPAPSDTDFNEIDLGELPTVAQAYAAAVNGGFQPVSLKIERRPFRGGGWPVFIFSDAAGKEQEIVFGKPIPAPNAKTESAVSQDASPDAAVTGVVQARAEANDHRKDGQPVLVDLATPYIKFTLDGKADNADVDGKFSGKGQTFSATVESKWAKIKDTDRQELKVNVTLDPTKPNVVVLNPTQNDLSTINQVNMLIWINRIHDWWSTRLKGDKRIDKQIPVNVNIHQDCNAYYTPGRPSLNFFRDSEECSDTGRPGVGMHEYGHFVDDMIGGITNGGMSEGWGDIGSMFILGTPIIGEGFLKNRNPSWIRHGENTYQYNENDEVHDQGQAWMGFAWKLRKALIASLGDNAGARIAEDLIVPTLFAKTSDIPSQMAQVLLRAMSNDGTIRYEKEIRAAAKAHGIDLPQNPGIIGGVADLANGLVGIVTGGEGVSVEEVASGVFEGANALVPEGFGQGDAKVVTKTFSLKAGRASRDEVRSKLEGAYKFRSGDYHDLGFKIEEQKGWRNSQFTITITGSEKSIEYMTKQIKRIGGQNDEAPVPGPNTGPGTAPLGPVAARASSDSSGGGILQALATQGIAATAYISDGKTYVSVSKREDVDKAVAFIKSQPQWNVLYTSQRLFVFFKPAAEPPSRGSPLASSLAPRGATSGLNAGASQDEAPMLKPLVEGWTVGDKTYGSTAELVASLPASDAPVDAVYRFAHTEKATPARPWANTAVGLVSGSLIGGTVGFFFALIGSVIGPLIDVLLGGRGNGGDLMQALIFPAMFGGMGAFVGAMIGRDESKKPGDPGIAIAGKIYRNAGPSGATMYFEGNGFRVDLGKYAQAQPLPAPVMPARLNAVRSAGLGAGAGALLALSQLIPLVQIFTLPFAGPMVGATVGSALSRDSGVAGGVLGGSLGLLVPFGALFSFAAAQNVGILLSLGAFVAALTVLGAVVGLFAANAVRSANAVDAAQKPAGQWWAQATKDRS